MSFVFQLLQLHQWGDFFRQQQLDRQQAAEDLGDIDFLSKCEPFNRYWVRRLNDLYLSRVILSRKGGTPEMREKARIESNLLEELTQMPANDRVTCKRNVDAPVPQAPQPSQAM